MQCIGVLMKKATFPSLCADPALQQAA